MKEGSKERRKGKSPMKKVRAGWLALLGFGCFCSRVERALKILRAPNGF